MGLCGLGARALGLSGGPVTVFVCGEAGAGKSRLIAEVIAAARARGTRTLVGSCTTVGRRSFAFAPFVEALRPVVRELAIEGEAGGRPVGPGLARLVSGPGGGAAVRGSARRVGARRGSGRAAGGDRGSALGRSVEPGPVRVPVP